MPLKKYVSLPTARMQMAYSLSQYRDVAVLDFSTAGHGVFHYGHLPWIQPLPQNENLYTTHLTEIDLALGDNSRLVSAVEELAERGYANLFLLPSSLGSVLGFDLQAMAEELSARFRIRILTVDSKLNDDFYTGMHGLTGLLAGLCSSELPKRSSTFNLIGGMTCQDGRNHQYLARVIEETLGLHLHFDSLAAESLAQWEQLSGAELNIITSEFALSAAEELQKRFQIPYLYLNPLGEKALHRDLLAVAEQFGLSCSFAADGVYENVVLQMRNILKAVRPQIVCYADADRLRALREFFQELEYPAEYVCSHAGSTFAYREANEFIEAFRDKFVLSYDRVCRSIPDSLTIERSGLDYSLMVPLPDATCGREGAYRLMQALSEKLIGRSR